MDVNGGNLIKQNVFGIFLLLKLEIFSLTIVLLQKYRQRGGVLNVTSVNLKIICITVERQVIPTHNHSGWQQIKGKKEGDQEWNSVASHTTEEHWRKMHY
ncbi:hypothetical protein XENOCAPTIV_005509 [Xenoophorus captivus]|uniref:Uncharacterized protein n=1 Tax=Xenoophorus captivus TaxID=1517983 RepID=A0ABV0RFN5_9TELE